MNFLISIKSLTFLQETLCDAVKIAKNICFANPQLENLKDHRIKSTLNLYPSVDSSTSLKAHKSRIVHLAHDISDKYMTAEKHKRIKEKQREKLSKHKKPEYTVTVLFAAYGKKKKSTFRKTCNPIFLRTSSTSERDDYVH